MNIDINSPHTLFNGYANANEPDWTKFKGLKVRPVNKINERCKIIHDLETLLDERISFWSVYGRTEDGVVEIITDIFQTKDVLPIVNRLEGVSSLPMDIPPILLAGDALDRANKLLHAIASKPLDTSGVTDDANMEKTLKDLKRKLTALETALNAADYAMRLKRGELILEAYICPCCGSDDVVVDAYAQWDPKANKFELHSTYQGSMTCNDCTQAFNAANAKSRFTNAA